MPDGMPEGGVGLAGEGAPRGVGDGAGDHEGQALAAVLEKAVDGEQGGLGVQGVEDGLHQQDVGAARHQPRHGVVVSRDQFGEADVAKTGPVDIRRDGGGAVGGAQDAGDEPGCFRRGVVIRRGPGQGRPGAVQLPRQILQLVIGHGDGRGVEGVGLDDVGAGLKEGPMDVPNEVGLGQGQQVVVSPQFATVIGEPGAAKVAFSQLAGLNHGAHGAIQ